MLLLGARGSGYSRQFADDTPPLKWGVMPIALPAACVLSLAVAQNRGCHNRSIVEGAGFHSDLHD